MHMLLVKSFLLFFIVFTWDISASNQRPFMLIDLYPTLLDLAGITPHPFYDPGHVPALYRDYTYEQPVNIRNDRKTKLQVS